MQDYGNRYPSSYGSMFYEWLKADNPQPYNSWGNGSAMRVSPVGWAFNTLEETLEAAKQSAEVTHNHPEGIKGAQATAACIYLARTGKSKQKIKEYIETTFGYNLSRTCDEIRPTYYFNESCQGTVPESIIAFLESTDYESAIRLTISLGGDADTMGAITGGIAEAYYKEIPQYIREEVLKRLPNEFIDIMQRFYEMFVDKRIIKKQHLKKFICCFFIIIANKNTMKPVDKFSIQYSELLEYIYPVTQEYFPDFDYDEETGQAYMLPSQTPDTFKGRYNRGILKGKFSIDAYMQNRELQDLLTTLDLDAEKFWYLLLFCYDCSWGKCMEGIEIKESPKEQIEKLVNAISEDYKRDTPFGAVFKSPICITLKIGRKNIVIDNKTAIASIAKFCADGLETVKSDQMNTSHVDLSDPHTESFSVFAYYFSQMIITALNYQEQVKEKRKKGANMSRQGKDADFSSTILHWYREQRKCVG